MNCKKCGCELKEGWKICPQCSAAIEQDDDVAIAEKIQQAEATKADGKQEAPSSDGKEKIFLISFLVSVACVFLIQPISGIAFVAALIIIVTGYIKYPKNRAIKVLFWLFLAWIVFIAVYTIALIAICTEGILSCGSSCR